MTQPTATKTAISVAYGDGIGPEIMKATLAVLAAAGAQLELDPIEIGERVYARGYSAGIEPSAWASLRRTKVFLKAPITTPQGGGFKSLNVTTRKSLGLYANVRPCRSYDPFVATKHPVMDVVIIRENEEDLYAGIEHRQTQEVYQCLKLISRPGNEKIARYAFEYAKANGRSKVSCFTKDNIMKLTDGIFHKVFDEVAAEYPELEHEHWIVDIGAAKLADTPEAFDVVVLPNLYGDILSDVAAQIAGSVGLAGSANIGEHGAMFEAIHGSAPPLAGRDVANPSGLLLGAVMMLVHIGQGEVAERVHNAWLRTLEDDEVVHHIPPNLTSQYRARLSRKKNDVVDASNAARALLANSELPAFGPSEGQREFQDLTRTQRRLSEQLKADRMALQALDPSSSARSALTQVIQVLEIQLTKLAEQMKTLVKASAPMLLELLGVGPVVASVILGEVGNIERFANEGQFASYCGAAPVERGSGKNTRMQLNHGGNRRLNWALHIVALTRSRCDERTKALLAKLKARGKTQRASLRILKTYIAREMFRHLRHSPSHGLANMMT